MEPVDISSVNRKSFLQDREFDIDSRVIQDVIENIETANLIEDPDVLNLLKSMWLHNLRKLKMAAREDGEESSPDEEEVVVVAQAPVPSSSGSQSWANTGARPKIRKTNLPLNLDGAADVSSSDDEQDVVTAEKSKPKKKLLKKRRVAKIGPQVDGPCDSSDSDVEDLDNEDENDEEDDDDDDDDDALGSNEEDEGAEEEPLGSGDDISDEDPSDLFNTENVVVCQYEKITRARNKWKFHLKDGIMNLNGRDYVFQRANGEAEW